MQRGLAAGDEWLGAGGWRETGGEGGMDRGRQAKRQGDRDEGKKGRGEECKRKEDVEQENSEIFAGVCSGKYRKCIMFVI